MHTASPAGHFAKFPGQAAVDASLVGLCTPYGLLKGDHPIVLATIGQIERELHRNGCGVYRYREDTYYGGGEWVLLAGWLGWHYAQSCTQ